MTELLRAFIITHRDQIIARTQARVVKRDQSGEDQQALAHGVPTFIAQLLESLEPNAADKPPRTTGDADSRKAISDTAALNGLELLKRGFSVSQVVHGYGDVCQVVTELAAERRASVSAEDFHVFNRCLDDAIAGAVTAFGLQRESVITIEGTERLGNFAHEMRNLLNTALLSFSVLKEGHVGFSGSTADVHARSLASLSTLAGRALSEVRLDTGKIRLQVHALAAIIGDLQVGLALQAQARAVRLNVMAVDPAILVMADRSLLESALTNLLQNALKFTRRGGLVTLASVANPDRVYIEVRDQCGGLPPGKIETLFVPFSQESTDRSGVGLGLSIARRAVSANDGTLEVHDLPGEGCVFCVDLPRHHLAAPGNIPL